MMLGSKFPNYDACGLFRASHSHNPHHLILQYKVNLHHKKRHQCQVYPQSLC